MDVIKIANQLREEADALLNKDLQCVSFQLVLRCH